MKITVLSLFPDMFQALHYGIPGRAIENKLLGLSYKNPRDFTKDKHRTVDDRPYGGGPGMLMKVQPLQDAIHAAKRDLTQDTPVIYLSPQGKSVQQADITAMAHHSSMILLCGRYEGVDERLINAEVDQQWSIGDYVLSGGELAAMVLIDAIARLLPGALGNEQSAEYESFQRGLLDCPHYTRPEHYAGQAVPEVLLSGDHAAIERWRLQQALGKTWLQRPDLLAQRELSDLEKQLLQAFIQQHACDK